VSLFDRQKQAIDEDPYSLPGNNSSSSGSRSSSGHYASTGVIPNQKSQTEPKPPKLPPRDFERNRDKGKSATKKTKNSQKSKPNQDYQEENIYSIGQNPRHFGKYYTRKIIDVSNDYELSNCLFFMIINIIDDPYYSGFSARVPNYAKRTSMPMSSHAQQTKQYDYHMRKVPSSGFLNSYLKSVPQHSRSASYQSFYGSLGMHSYNTTEESYN
jgi:hypothetical protein